MGKQPAEEIEPSLADLLGDLVGDGKELVRAEAKLYQEIAIHRAEKASGGAMALVLGGLLIHAALIGLVVGAAFALAPYVGPLLASLIVAIVIALIGFVLIRFGLAKLKALGGDAEEKAALEAGKGLA